MLRLLLTLSLLSSTTLAADHAAATSAIKTVMEDQQAAWNTGDIPGFMAGYLNSEKLRFASGGSVTHGWIQTLARYQKHYDSSEKMGQLKFEIKSIDVFSADTAMVFGRWELTLASAEIKPNGLFTLIFKKTATGWRIAHDHTSSADK